MLRILLYANVDGAEAGGVQGAVRGLRAYLAGRGHRVSTGWAQRSNDSNAGDDGWVEAFHLRGVSGGRQLHFPTLARLALRLLRERPHIVNIHFASPSVLYFEALKAWLGFRVVVTCHGSDILRPLGHDAPHLARLIGQSDAVTVVSEQIASKLASDGITPPGKSLFIANGVDTEFWIPITGRAPQSTCPSLVAVGRLEPVKGFDILIEACAALAERGKRVRLTIIGEGSQGKALAALAARLGIGEQVHLVGRHSPRAIRSALRAASAFVMPSRSEGMPLALMEALATGTPAIATDVGGVARTAGGAAVLVPSESPEALAAAIADLLHDECRMADLRQRARERALAFSSDATHAAYEKLLAEIAPACRK